MKIFCAVGNMNRDFTRFIKKIRDLDEFNDFEIVLQSGYSLTDNIKWKNTSVHAFLSPSQFNYQIGEADLVICHAGVGVITDCLRSNKMPVVMARSAVYFEHVNDHQVDFVSRYSGDGIFYSMDDNVNIVEFVRSVDLALTPKRNFIHDLGGMRACIHRYLRENLRKCS